MVRDLLLRHRHHILHRWTELVLDDYPAEAGPFLKGEKDRFRNPVGYTIVDGLEKIYDELLGGFDEAKVGPAVEGIMQMRAVQDFSPSAAVGFAGRLKDAVREALEAAAIDWASGAGQGLFVDLMWFEERVDAITLLAVGSYARYREKVFEARLREAKAGGMIAAAGKDRRIR